MENLWFTREHEWIKKQSNEYFAGISAYAVEQLGDIVFVELPSIGDIFAAQEVFGTVESTKTVSDLYMPSAGEVIAINTQVVSKPELVQEDPYIKGWLIKFKATVDVDYQKLMNADNYQAYLASAEGN